MMELANHEMWPGMDGAMRWCQEHFITLRIMGSSALAIAQVAAGRAVGCFLGGSNYIDVSAAMLIAREAGAGIRSQRADGQFGSGIGLVAAHPAVLDEMWSAAFSKNKE